MKKIKVLFICIQNSCRSQMAEGLAKHFGQDQIMAFSAGSKPTTQVDPGAVAIMQEIGIDIAQQKPKSFADLDLKSMDYVITLGCKENCPFIPGVKRIDWFIEDPKEKERSYYVAARQLLENKIKEFLGQI